MRRNKKILNPKVQILMIILLSYNFYDSYFDNVEFSREDKNGINVLRAKISRLTTA